MTMYIEVLVLVVIALLFFFWFIWSKISKWISERRYKQKDDKGYQAEENRRRLIAEGKPDPAKSISNDAGLTEPPEQSILPTTKTNDIGEADNSTGKTSTSNGRTSKRFRRNPFRRR